MSSLTRPPRLLTGAYAATLTFFQSESEDLDLDTLRKHVTRLAQAGLSGIVALGSNGEAAHLSTLERNQVVSTVRNTLTTAGFSRLPVIVGASGQSVVETIRLCHDAATVGGDYVLVLPPCYFKAAMTDEAIF